MSSEFCHHEADFTLAGATARNNAADLSAAKDENPVCKFQKHIQILTDIDDGDALGLLLVDQIINCVRRVNVQTANRISGKQDGRS